MADHTIAASCTSEDGWVLKHFVSNLYIKKVSSSATCNITMSVGVSDALGEMIFQTRLPAKKAFHVDSKY